MPRDKMRDLVVLLPGITGSVLQKDNEDLWAVSGQSLWTALRDRKGRLEALKVPDHKPGETPPDDGIRATRLIYDFHGVFGLWKIDGYNTMARLITDNFEVTPGNLSAPREDQNFFEFFYDWRRSNRDSARTLQKFVEQQLHSWRRWSHWKDARVILLAHSMGGLVSRYYLEVLEGWRDCRALLTFGTPYRGSLNAVNYVANGYKMAGIDFTDVMRTMPSIYELMPIYPAINIDGSWHRVAEGNGLPKEIVKEKAADALRFHREIEEAVTKHRDSADPFLGSARRPVVDSFGHVHAVAFLHDVSAIIDCGNCAGNRIEPGRQPSASSTPSITMISLPLKQGSLASSTYSDCNSIIAEGRAPLLPRA